MKAPAARMGQCEESLALRLHTLPGIRPVESMISTPAVQQPYVAFARKHEMLLANSLVPRGPALPQAADHSGAPAAANGRAGAAGR